jgi:hypothetical protein
MSDLIDLSVNKRIIDLGEKVVATLKPTHVSRLDVTSPGFILDDTVDPNSICFRFTPLFVENNKDLYVTFRDSGSEKESVLFEYRDSLPDGSPMGLHDILKSSTKYNGRHFGYRSQDRQFSIITSAFFSDNEMLQGTPGFVADMIDKVWRLKGVYS